MERDARPDELMQQHAGIAVQRAQRSQTTPAHTTDQLGCIVAFEYLEAPSLSLSLRAYMCASCTKPIGDRRNRSVEKAKGRARDLHPSNAIRDSRDYAQSSELELS